MFISGYIQHVTKKINSNANMMHLFGLWELYSLSIWILPTFLISCWDVHTVHSLEALFLLFSFILHSMFFNGHIKNTLLTSPEYTENNIGWQGTHSQPVWTQIPLFFSVSMWHDACCSEKTDAASTSLRLLTGSLHQWCHISQIIDCVFVSVCLFLWLQELHRQHGLTVCL